MIFWLLALLLLGGFGYLGKFSGAVRMGVSLLGALLGAILAFTVGPKLSGLAATAGIENPLGKVLIPPLVVFALMLIIFNVLSQVAHLQVTLYYKYKASDERRVRWERMNAGTGLAIGMVQGAVWLVVLGLLVYIPGYLTVQVESPNQNPFLVRVINSGKEALRSSGFEKLVASVDPAPERYYQAADVIGLLYHNPQALARLSTYPAMLILTERPEVQAIVADQAFFDFLKKQPNLDELRSDAKVQAIVNNQEIRNQLAQFDLKDLYNYLLTGTSAKYQEELILGRWEVYVPATLIQIRQKHQISTADAIRLKRIMGAIMQDVTLIAAPDKQVLIKATMSLKQMADVLAGKLPLAEQSTGEHKVISQGTWEKQGADYQLSMKDDLGEHTEGLTILSPDTLRMTFGQGTLVFTRVE